MVVTGAKSEDDSRLASRKYARIIQKLGFDAKFAEFKIQNIVGSCDVKFPIRLEGLAFSHGAFSSYEPEVSWHFFIAQRCVSGHLGCEARGVREGKEGSLVGEGCGERSLREGRAGYWCITVSDTVGSRAETGTGVRV
jgi:hypothetical protein